MIFLLTLSHFLESEYPENGYSPKNNFLNYLEPLELIKNN